MELSKREVYKKGKFGLNVLSFNLIIEEIAQREKEGEREGER